MACKAVVPFKASAAVQFKVLLIIDFLEMPIKMGVFKLLKNGMFFQTRYNLGLSNVNSGSNANAIKYTNSVIQVSVGIKL